MRKVTKAWWAAALLGLGCLSAGCLTQQERKDIEARAARLSESIERLEVTYADLQAKIKATLAKVEDGTLSIQDGSLLLGELQRIRDGVKDELTAARGALDDVRDQLEGKPWYEQLEGLLWAAIAVATNTAASRKRRGVNVLTGREP